jgi:hypothetical protein
VVLTAPQHSQVAAAYERAARDEALPLQARSAFAKKASWFRMLAQISAAKKARTRFQDPHSLEASPSLDLQEDPIS